MSDQRGTPAGRTRRSERTTRRFERAQRHAGDRGSGYSPRMMGSSGTSADDRERWLGREIDMLQRALEEHGELKRGDLGRLVGCRYWGPGRFSAALRAAVARGAIEHTGFGRYGPVARGR
jgi:hypothetical protein